jgi:hypothetical protein
MFKISSKITVAVWDEKGNQKADEDGKPMTEPASCQREGFNWPPEGVIVPDDFFVSEAQLVRLIDLGGLDIVHRETDIDEWKPVELESVPVGDGVVSPSVAHGTPSPDVIAGAKAKGIGYVPPTSTVRGVDPRKVERHVDRMLGKDKQIKTVRIGFDGR